MKDKLFAQHKRSRAGRNFYKPLENLIGTRHDSHPVLAVSV